MKNLNPSTKLHFQLRILTPVTVGSGGEDLSPYMDYVLNHEGSTLQYIDKEALFFQLNEAGLLEDFSNKMLQIENNTAKLLLGPYISDKLGVPIEKVRLAEVPNKGVRLSSKIQIQTAIKTAGKPYIPGSTLKGAIRTALLYNWLMSPSTSAQKTLENSLRKIQGCHRLVQQLEPLRKKRKSRNRLSGQEFRNMRNLERELRTEVRGILGEEWLFGKLNDREKAPLSQHMRVSDTHSLNLEDLGIYQANRIRLKPLGQNRNNKSASIPQPRESIQPGRTLDFSIELRTEELSQSKLKGLTKNPVQSLLKNIRAFSQACMGYEISELENSEDMPNPAAKQSLLNFYNQLYNRSKDGETFMRLGLGKTYFDNSLGLALLNYIEDTQKDDQMFRAFRKVLLDVPEEAEFFPVTRTVIEPGFLPMGWVKVEKLN